SSFFNLWPMSNDLRCQRHDLHEPLAAQLASYRPEDARPDRLQVRVEQHRAVRVELDVAAILALVLASRANDDRLRDIALLHARGRKSLLDRHDDEIAEAGIPAAASTEHLDASDSLGTAVVGDVELRLHLDHGTPPPPGGSRAARPPSASSRRAAGSRGSRRGRWCGTARSRRGRGTSGAA